MPQKEQGKKDQNTNTNNAATPSDHDQPACESAYASPPCFMHELDPEYMGYMGRDDIVKLLNELLEAERAGACAVGEMSQQSDHQEIQPLLRNIARDESRFCAMLTRHIRNLGGTPCPMTGPFYKKLMAIQDFSQRLDFLNRGQGWVVRRLQDTIPQIRDELLHRDLKDMLDVHEQNIRHCNEL